MLRANGGVWHQNHREAGIVPHSSIDVEAPWTKSGWHGWVYGWKLHLIVAEGEVWIPVAAELTAANGADNREAGRWVEQMATPIRYPLGAASYQDPTFHTTCAGAGMTLIASQHGPHPHTDDGAQGRKRFHREAISAMLRELMSR